MGHIIELLVFSVTPFKIDQNKKSKPFNRLKKKEGKYSKTLAKIQGTAILLEQDMQGIFYPNLEEIYGGHVDAHPDEHQHGGQKPTETSVTEFCYYSSHELVSQGTQKH